MSSKETLLTVQGEGEHGFFSYPIIRSGDFCGLAGELEAVLGGKDGKLCLVSDSNVSALYLQEVQDALQERFTLTMPFVFPAGEENKQLSTIECLYRHMLHEKMERNDILLALGGGVTGDMTGYAAATYRRGIRFVQIPTSLLAMVDSSIGGKTGVDLDQYKNMIGAFHQPVLVYMNLSTLQTLPDDQFSSGMGEVIKSALIRDSALFSFLETDSSRILDRDPEALGHMVQACCTIKADVVKEDPLDTGLRAILNFGHTIGHAVETCTDFAWLHGCCVALGSAGAARMSAARRLLPEEDLARIQAVLRTYGLPDTITGISAERILEACCADKKSEQGKLRFILLNGIGDTCIEQDMQKEELRKAIDECIR